MSGNGPAPHDKPCGCHGKPHDGPHDKPCYGGKPHDGPHDKPCGCHDKPHEDPHEGPHH